jgi:hypothetical protein
LIKILSRKESLSVARTQELVNWALGIELKLLKGLVEASLEEHEFQVSSQISYRSGQQIKDSITRKRIQVEI